VKEGRESGSGGGSPSGNATKEVPSSLSTLMMIDDDVEACLMREDYLRESFALGQLGRIGQQVTTKLETSASVLAAVANNTNINDASNIRAIFAYDKTPQYLRLPGLAPVVHRLFGGRRGGRGGVKLVTLLRDPVSRYYSSYKMYLRRCSAFNRSAEDFDEFMRHDFSRLREALDLTRRELPSPDEYNHNSISGKNQSDADDLFRYWKKRLSFEERVHRIDQHVPSRPPWKPMYVESCVYTGMYATHLSEWLRYFKPGEDLLVVHYESLQNVNGSPNTEAYNRIFGFLGLVDFENRTTWLGPDRLDGSYNTAPDKQKVTDAQTMSDSARRYLRDFYRPHNDELADLLGEEWRGYWE